MGELNQSGVILSTDGSTAKVQMKRRGACSGDHAGCPWNDLIVGYFTGWATANLLGLSYFAGISGGIFMAVAFMGSFLAIRKRAKAYNASYELVRIYGANRINSYLGDRRICATPCRRLKRWPEK